MQRMTGTDASFLYAETPWQFAHTLKIAILEVGRSWSFERAREGVARAIDVFPAYASRPVSVPLNLYHPVWVHDRPVDLDRHLTRHVLPPGADDRALDAFVAAFASRPLDRDRPLWHVAIVEGLKDGRVAVVAKVHHGLADGAAAAVFLDAITTAGPDGAPALGPPVPNEPTPAWSALVRAAAGARLRSLLLAPMLAVTSVVRLARSASARRASEVDLPGPFDAPFTSFNQPLSTLRTFARSSVPLVAVRRVKDAWGCTVNDVILALVTGSLRRYLIERGEPIEGPLIASMPLSTAEQPHLHGNHLSNTFVALPIHLEDPLARLLEIRRSTAAVKQVHERLGRDMFARWLDVASAVGLRTFWATIARLFMPNPINLVVSSVKGPSARRWLGGAPIVELYSVGPVLERIGLNVTAWSYGDRVAIGVLSCPRNVPWPDEIADGVVDALQELVGAAFPRPVTSPNEPVDEAPWRAPTSGWLESTVQ